MGQSPSNSFNRTDTSWHLEASGLVASQSPLYKMTAWLTLSTLTMLALAAWGPAVNADIDCPIDSIPDASAEFCVCPDGVTDLNADGVCEITGFNTVGSPDPKARCRQSTHVWNRFYRKCIRKNNRRNRNNEGIIEDLEGDNYIFTY